jgi:hypothetical protein
LTDLSTLYCAMMWLHFDHFMPAMKGEAWPGHAFKTSVYWYCTPMVLEMNPEKCSGCFVHDGCRHMVL